MPSFVASGGIIFLYIMEAKELRTGNLIYGTIKGFDMKELHTVDFSVIAFLSGGIKSKLVALDFEPIPLTEEWLIKFGFKKSTIEPIECDYSKKYDISSNVFLNGYTVFKNDFANVGIKETEIKIIEIQNYLDESQGFESIGNSLKYVHKLQNIYFALTDEELKLNE